ncbi:MAG TPA: helix-turn-helix domain-containing protein [Xanthobacteraceae bacterium]
MTERSTNPLQTNASTEIPVPDRGDGGSPPKLRGLETNPEGACGPQMWQAFRESMAHLYTVSLPDPAEEARFTLSNRIHATPQGVLMRCRGTAFIMTRGPVLTAQSPDQLLVVLQVAGRVETDYGGRRTRREVGDVEIIDYARPFRSAATDYELVIMIVARDSVPAALLGLEPHGLLFQRGSGAARLIGAALQEFQANADDLTVGEAEAAIEGILALTTTCTRLRLAGGEAEHVRSRRKAALDYIDAHLADAQLGPAEIAEAANVSRASLYRLLATEGGIRAVLLKRRLDAAVRLMLTGGGDERSLTDIAGRCGFAGMSQFSRAFRARFGAPPAQFRALVRRQDLEWHEARFVADGFDKESMLWHHQGFPGSKPDGTAKPGKKRKKHS